MPSIAPFSSNQLLAILPTEELALLAAALEPVELRLGQILYEPGEQMQHVYFPTTSIISLHYVTESGASVETSGVGNDGLLGISLLMGGDTTPSSAMVQTAGQAWRLERYVARAHFERSRLIRRAFLNYTEAMITQTFQTAVCNRHHSLLQQLCRWLLMTLDRIPSGQLVMTQELIATMLGVRREGVTVAAGELQRAGFIHLRRGHISVLDRHGLEATTCECYAVVKKESRRLLAARMLLPRRLTF